jgi:hypothetical protein
MRPPEECSTSAAVLAIGAVILAWWGFLGRLVWNVIRAGCSICRSCTGFLKPRLAATPRGIFSNLSKTLAITIRSGSLGRGRLQTPRCCRNIRVVGRLRPPMPSPRNQGACCKSEREAE